MNTIKFEKTITSKGHFDVIVVGGGVAGVAAAVSAARNGVSVLLIEKSVNLGGLATGGLISWYEPLCDGKGNQVMSGMVEELIRLCCKCGFDNLPPKWGGSGHNSLRNERFSTYYSPTLFSLALDEFVIDNGVTLRFDTLATYPVMEDGICKGVIAESINECEFFEASMVIDATGNAMVMDRAGVPTVEGQNYMTYIAHMFTREDAETLVSNKDICKFRHWKNAGSSMTGKGHPEGMKKISGTDADETTEYIVCGKKMLLDKLSENDKNSFDIMSIPTMPQFRTIRRIVGNIDFCGENGKKFEDSIGQCGDFRSKGIGNIYHIPFGSLWNEKFPNLLAAGRIISAPQGDGWEVSRVIPVCVLTGEAAGRAAALCVKNKKMLCDLNINDIKKIKIN